MPDSILEQLETRMAAREAAQEPAPDEAEERGLEAPEPAQEGEEGPSPEEEVETLLDFAAAAGWDPEDVYKLKINLDTGEALSLGEVKDALQNYSRERGAVQQQTQRLQEYAAQLQGQAQQYFQQRAAESDAIRAARENVMLVEARYNGVDWDQLAKADPGRAAYLQQQIAVDYANAKQDLQNAAEREQQAVQQWVEQTRAQHAKALLEVVPEWRDPARIQQEYSDLQDYLVGQGFRPDELGTIYDYRAISVARKAMLYDKGQAKMKETADKVRSAPKPVVRPGGAGLKGAAAQAHTSALIKKARETGNRADKAAAAAAVLQRAANKR